MVDVEIPRWWWWGWPCPDWDDAGSDDEASEGEADIDMAALRLLPPLPPATAVLPAMGESA
jgi:hypothetical protein